MTTILKTLTYARIGINRGTGDDLQRRTGIRQLNQAMDLLEKGYQLTDDIDNLPELAAPAADESEGKEDAVMGPKATTPAKKNSGSTKPSNGGKNQPRPTTKPANSGRK